MSAFNFSNNSNAGTSTPLTTQGLTVLLVVAADATLALLSFLLYLPLLRAAWKLPKKKILPWILLNLVFMTILHLARITFVMLKIIINELKGVGVIDWEIPTNIYCRTVNILVVTPYSPNNAIPLVFALIEVACLRRPALVAKQWLFNCVGSVGIWVASFGVSVPYIPLTYTQPSFYGSLTCQANEYDYAYVIFISHAAIYTLSVYSVFLLHLTLSGREKWGKSHRIVLESLICILTMYNIQLVLFLIALFFSENLELTSVASFFWMLSDSTATLSGVIILIRYKNGRRLAKSMFLFCRRPARLQPVDSSTLTVPVQQTQNS